MDACRVRLFIFGEQLRLPRNTQAASKSASDEAPASKKTADDKKVPDLESIVAGSLYQTDEERSMMKIVNDQSCMISDERL